MLDWLLNLDKQLFIALNSAGSPYLDQFMIWMSDRYLWFPFYGYLLFRLYQHYGKRSYFPIIALIVVIVCTDQITSTLMKPYFGRLRPCKDPLLEGIIRVIGKCRGSYGFSSGHAANAFALAGFFYFLEKSTFTKIMLIWAAVIAYSRIYLGVHYPGDVLVGSVIGILFSLAGATLLQHFRPEFKAYSRV